jgi:hypothetical protein
MRILFALALLALFAFTAPAEISAQTGNPDCIENGNTILGIPTLCDPVCDFGLNPILHSECLPFLLPVGTELIVNAGTRDEPLALRVTVYGYLYDLHNDEWTYGIVINPASASYAAPHQVCEVGALPCVIPSEPIRLAGRP